MRRMVIAEDEQDVRPALRGVSRGAEEGENQQCESAESHARRREARGLGLEEDFELAQSCTENRVLREMLRSPFRAAFPHRRRSRPVRALCAREGPGPPT